MIAGRDFLWINNRAIAKSTMCGVAASTIAFIAALNKENIVDCVWKVIIQRSIGDILY